MLRFTHSSFRYVKVENTPVGRDVIAFEDRFLLKCTMQCAKIKLLRGVTLNYFNMVQFSFHVRISPFQQKRFNF